MRSAREGRQEGKASSIPQVGPSGNHPVARSQQPAFVVELTPLLSKGYAEVQSSEPSVCHSKLITVASPWAVG